MRYMLYYSTASLRAYHRALPDEPHRQTIYREPNIDRLESFFRGRDCGFLCIVQGHISDLVYLYVFIAISKLPAVVFWVHFEVLGSHVA